MLILNIKVAYNQRESVKPYYKEQKYVLYAWTQNEKMNANL